MTSNIKLFAHKHNTAKLVRAKMRTESALLEKIGRLEQILDSQERSETGHAEYLAEFARAEADLVLRRDAASGAEQKQLARALQGLRTRRREAEAQMRELRRRSAKAMAVFRQDQVGYLELIREIGGRRTVGLMAEATDEERELAAATGPGNTLLGTLGQAVFAWRASNAFDDLAKLSGRKK